MKKRIKRILKRIILRFIISKYRISFSKSGEDIILAKIFQNSKKGFYVDVGCWDPIKASNTYFFYLRGWTGLCIDPNPELKKSYQKVRPKDSFLNVGVSNNEKLLDYYILSEGVNTSMNTFDLEFLKKQNLEMQIKKKEIIKTFTLERLFKENVGDKKIDFIDVDVEGMDLDVLKSNNWKLYRPKVVLVESSLEDIKADLESEISKFMKNNGYHLIAKTYANSNLGNLFYMDNLK